MVTIKLDWDEISLKTAGIRMGKMYDAFGKYPELYRTPHGFHCYLKVSKRINPDDMFLIRAYYQDDPLRVMLDRKRMEQGMDWDVLFQDYEEKVPEEVVRKLVNRYSFIKGA